MIIPIIKREMTTRPVMSEKSKSVTGDGASGGGKKEKGEGKEGGATRDRNKSVLLSIQAQKKFFAKKILFIFTGLSLWL